MSSFKSIIMIIIVILLLLFGIKQQVDINTLEKNNTELEQKLEEWNDKVEKLEYALDMTDEEYLENEARQEFMDPDSMHFTNDYSN